MKALLSFFFCSLFFLPAFSHSAEEWKSRVIYQIITDRFAKTDGDSTPCQNLGNYCGGTFKGIQNNLNYIQDLGFNAIWISPVVANAEGGYHGYWANDFYKINEHFGTEQDLIDLINACHERDIWVMVDVIANHVGYVNNWDYSSIVPFNDPSHYNNYVDCNSLAGNDYNGHESCWLLGLPDLNQNNEFVRKTLLEWVHEFVAKYHIDGLRLDALKHVSRSFWKEFTEASGVFTIGELFDFDVPYLASYQGSVDSLLNFPFYSTLRYAFQQGGSMNTFQYYYDGASATYKDITVLGNFVNNHDIPRFLSDNGNVAGFKAAVTFVIGSVGIPTVYYGDEQGFGGGADPGNREPLWTNMNQNNEFYQHIKTINEFRKKTQFFNHEQVQRYADDSFYAFTRGEHLFAFTNNHDYQLRTISYHPYAEGTTLCNIFHSKDCVEVRDGKFEVVLIGGEAKVFSPRYQEDGAQSLNAYQKIKTSWRDSISLGIKKMSSSSRISG